MKVKNKLIKTISMMMCLVILSTFLFPAIPNAAATFEVYYNSGVVGNGGSVHYTSSPVIIGISVSGATDFYVTFGGSGTTGTVSLTSDNGSYNEYSFGGPSGPVIFNVVADGVPLPTQTINFYHDTVIDPGASLSYVSVKARINKVDSNPIPAFDVDYDGYNNTGVNIQQVNDAFPALGYTNPGTYQLRGKLQVAVFVNGSLDGYYWTDDPALYSKYNWGTALTDELDQRKNWGSSEYITPTVVVPIDGSLTVRYKDNTTHLVIASAKTNNGLALPSNASAIVNNSISGYNTNPTSYMLWYGSEDMAGSQIKKPFSGTVMADLNDTQPNGFVYYFYDKIPPENGRVNINTINVDTNEVISATAKDNLVLPYDETIDKSILPAPENSSYEGANKSYTSSKPAVADRLYGATAQTVSLTDSQKEAWVYFYYKISGPVPTPTATSTPTPTPTPTPDPRQPPNAIIESANEVMMGDDISIRSNSHDGDGEIVSHTWTAPTVKVPLINWGNVTWFDYVGTATINLKVTDNDGLTGYASKTINILPPVPTAVITYSGRLKENYKITIDSVNSKSPKRYPIDNSKTVWKISAVSGCSDSDIKYLGTLSGTQSKDFLVKKAGRIKVELTVTNTAGYSASSTTLIDISENLAPIAQLYAPARTLRENVDEQGRRYGDTTVYDTSYSPDGDKIIYRKYYYRYDSNNNRNYDEETLNVLYEGITTQATRRYYNDQAVGHCRYDIYVEEDLMEKDPAGNYINTIPDFITSDDIKKADTFSIRLN